MPLRMLQGIRMLFNMDVNLIQYTITTTTTPSVGPAFAGSGEIQLLATLPLLAFLPIERPIPRDPRKEFCENILNTKAFAKIFNMETF